MKDKVKRQSEMINLTRKLYIIKLVYRGIIDAEGVWV